MANFDPSWDRPDLTPMAFPEAIHNPPTVREIAFQRWERGSNSSRASTDVSSVSSYEASVRRAAASTRMDSEESACSSADEMSFASAQDSDIADCSDI